MSNVLFQSPQSFKCVAMRNKILEYFLNTLYRCSIIYEQYEDDRVSELQWSLPIKLGLIFALETTMETVFCGKLWHGLLKEIMCVAQQCQYNVQEYRHVPIGAPLVYCNYHQPVIGLPECSFQAVPVAD